ncbi:VanW family protein [Nonlabens xiamenensis]|uniref:VanW family protein n=1 Tax=Nonlabens xiamenensis TaxID=2341043 RepID=UPI0013DE5FAB|nr:VanW family protein [Nonlabens xiamenensis]
MDNQCGFLERIASTRIENAALEYRISIRQPIKVNKGSQNKIHNIQLAFDRLQHLIIEPGQTFSFWHFIPRPTARNNYKKGRNLIKGQLQEDYGGGLCQLSGMIYLCLLKSGVTILERHHHSTDIYTDDTRYTPLGSDATVVYGFKDLRFENCLDQRLGFDLEFQKDSIEVSLTSDKPLTENEISWHILSESPVKIVETRNAAGAILTTSRYQINSSQTI